MTYDRETAPLISVITPTHYRHDALLSRCIPSVFEQTYPRIEHIIVSDGVDRTLAHTLSLDLWRRPLKTRPLVFSHIDARPPELPIDYGSRARNHGLGLAAGTFIAFLDDDNAYRPDHLEILMDALMSTGADFAYSQLERHPSGEVIGNEPPRYCHIDTSLILHRVDLPGWAGMWPTPEELSALSVDLHAPDWGVVQRWLNNDARWTFVPRVTLDYYMP